MYPLEYQLVDGYPFFPQETMFTYCATNNILFVDLFPALRANKRSNQVFIGSGDVWHLSRRGEDVAAEEIQRFLLRTGLKKRPAL